ncbi:hypothetical protein KI688_003903 [Linnemannia hyalina]|uniref:Uncharacterized protein n=1 Tax=Linnemannia hyalina TaxID=64524 RepID=A0A9P8BQC1_9FUNG|nr:hypothetical protein KI688_003903 [Linnemannia hyalina]
MYSASTTQSWIGHAYYCWRYSGVVARTAQQKSAAGDIISVYASSGVLRDRASKLAVNENTHIEQSLKPLITETIDPFPLPPDYEERLHPDLFNEKDGLPFAMLEVKSPDVDGDDCDVDVRKVFLLMRLSLNCLLEAGVEDPVILGMLVQVFSMDITYKRIYAGAKFQVSKLDTKVRNIHD